MWPLGLALLFLALMLYFFPFRIRLEYDPDEGINLIKALLVGRGYPLYRAIWSDQPPLFTFMLAGWMHVFGFHVIPARILMLVMSTLLLWGATEFLRRAVAPVHAIFGATLIALLPYYTRLSASVLIGLPGITFAVLSLGALAIWHQRRRDIWLGLSAAAFSISVGIKLLTGFLGPITVIGLLLDEHHRQPQLASWIRILKPALLWGSTAAMLAGLAMMLLVGPGNLSQLISPHLAAAQTPALVDPSQNNSLTDLLSPSRYVLLLAILGGVFALTRGRWLCAYLLAWGGAAIALLSIQTPLWYHHQLLVTVPAAMLAGAGAGEAWDAARELLTGRRTSWPRLIAAMLAAALFGLTLRSLLPDALGRFTTHQKATARGDADILENNNILAEMAEYSGETHWIVTDMPIYAFRAGLLVPPELAVFTKKRLRSGFLSESQVIGVIDAYRPEQILLGRFKLDRLKEFLHGRYALALQGNAGDLYVREDLKSREP